MLRNRLFAAAGIAFLVPGAGLFVSPNWSEMISEQVTPNRGAVQTAVLLAAREHQVDPAVIESVIEAESSFRGDAVSPKGAVGLMQVMPDTARELGFNPGHWQQNIEAGTVYLGLLLRRYRHRPDGIQLALAAYNAGPGNVAKYRGIPPFRETRTYVKRVMSRYRQLKREKRFTALAEPAD